MLLNSASVKSPSSWDFHLKMTAPYLSPDADINKPSRSHLIFLCPFFKSEKVSAADFPSSHHSQNCFVTCQSKIRSATRSPPLTELDLGLASVKDWVMKRKDGSQGKKQKIAGSN